MFFNGFLCSEPFLMFPTVLNSSQLHSTLPNCSQLFSAALYAPRPPCTAWRTGCSPLSRFPRSHPPEGLLLVYPKLSLERWLRRRVGVGRIQGVWAQEGRVAARRGGMRGGMRGEAGCKAGVRDARRECGMRGGSARRDARRECEARSRYEDAGSRYEDAGSRDGNAAATIHRRLQSGQRGSTSG